jgi:hypothetical protein
MTAYPTDRNFLPELWSDEGIADVAGSASLRLPLAGRVIDSVYARLGGILGYAGGSSASFPSRGYGRVEAELHGIAFTDSLTRLSGRLFAGWTSANMPRQRSLYAASRDPISTFENHFYRPRGALLKQLSDYPFGEVLYLPLGGASLRGYGAGFPLDRVVATNLEARRRLTTPYGSPRGLALWGGVFADAGVGRFDIELADEQETFFDVGPSVALRGRLYDRDVQIRVDVPVYVKGLNRSAPSVLVSFNDLW